jgi:hypothetical protein
VGYIQVLDMNQEWRILHTKKLHSWNTLYYCVPETSILYDFKTLKITGYQSFYLSFPTEVNHPSPKHGTFLGADGADRFWTGQQICWYMSWTANKGKSSIKSIGWGASKPLSLKETSMLTHWGRVTQICVYTHINNLNTRSPMC